MRDESIAGQVGVSLSTAHRRIKGMMLAANAQNRAQLGWRAACDGWL